MLHKSRIAITILDASLTQIYLIKACYLIHAFRMDYRAAY